MIGRGNFISRNRKHGFGTSLQHTDGQRSTIQSYYVRLNSVLDIMFSIFHTNLEGPSKSTKMWYSSRIFFTSAADIFSMKRGGLQSVFIGSYMQFSVSQCSCAVANLPSTITTVITRTIGNSDKCKERITLPQRQPYSVVNSFGKFVHSKKRFVDTRYVLHDRSIQ